MNLISVVHHLLTTGRKGFCPMNLNDKNRERTKRLGKIAIQKGEGGKLANKWQYTQSTQIQFFLSSQSFFPREKRHGLPVSNFIRGSRPTATPKPPPFLLLLVVLDCREICEIDESDIHKTREREYIHLR